MIEYDGYLDRSRLGLRLFAEGSLYSKRFFSIFKELLIVIKKKYSFIINYQFTHEYKKLGI